MWYAETDDLSAFEKGMLTPLPAKFSLYFEVNVAHDELPCLNFFSRTEPIADRISSIL